MSTTYTQFKGLSNLGKPLLMNELEINLKSYLDWSFLGIGGWVNVSGTTSGVAGGDFNNLQPVADPTYTNGQVWQGARKDWVYETGIVVSGHIPVSTQVYINSGLQSPTGYYIDYPLGRVIFTAPQATTASVEANYSYRNVQVYRADDAPWYTELQMYSTRPDDIQFTQTTNYGEWSIGGQHRIQLPAIIIEAVPRAYSTPYEIGNTALTIYQDVLFHILAESRFERNQLLDIIRYQDNKTIWLYNSQTVAQADKFPLDYRGAYVTGYLYPDLVDNYPFVKCFFNKSSMSEVIPINSRLFEGTIRMTCEMILGDVG